MSTKRKQHHRPPCALEKRAVRSRGIANRRIIGEAISGDREYRLHATKGYRSFRR